MGILDGKVAIVTGASSGIGKGAALRFAKEGAKVIVAARTEAKLQVVVDEIKAAGGEATLCVADISKEEDNKRLVEVAESIYGGLHVAFNNAGVYAETPIVEATNEEFDAIFGPNFKSVMFGLKYQIPSMAKSGDKGSIIVNTSVMGGVSRAKFPGTSLYSASKAAADSLVKYGAIEAAASKVRVNSIAPGFIRSPINAGMDDNTAQGFAAMCHLIERPGQPEEVAALATFLASDEASFITGSIHLVDGGFSLKA